MTRATTTDVVCVGGGLGGLAAATTAAELGAEVTVLEGSSFIGGVAAYSGGWAWVGANDLARQEGIDDSLEAVETYLDGVQRNPVVDRARRRSYLRAAIAATTWFVNHDVPLHVVESAPDLFHRCPGSTSHGRALEAYLPASDLGTWADRLRPSPYYRTGVTRTDLVRGAGPPDQPTGLLTHGQGLVGAFAHGALVRREVDCALDTRVVSLLTDGDRVTGVVAHDGQGERRIHARRGVILATGGYGGTSPAADREGTPEFVEASPPVVEGAGESLARAVGAAWVRGADPFVVLGAQLDTRVHPGSHEPLLYPLLESTGFPGSIIVNGDGRRFGDESYYGSLIAGLREQDATGRWRNHPCWLVVDDRFRQRYRLGPLNAGQPYPAAYVTTAPDAPQLAREAGIDPDGLVATIARFNKLARNGIDDDFGRGQLAFTRRIYGDPSVEPNPNLGPLATPPFHAVPLRILGVGLCTFGLDVDTHARVLDDAARPIPGLYATGNAAATHVLDGYVTGLANARNYTLAWLAARHAIGQSG